MPWGEQNVARLEPLLNCEWLVTNGLGGYAAGTVEGVVTRCYHGLLIAAFPPPFGRMLMLAHLSEQLRLPDGRTVAFGGEERTGKPVYGARYLAEFRLEAGLPVWAYEIDGIVIEKRVFLLHQQNTVCATYRMLEGPERLLLRLFPRFTSVPTTLRSARPCRTDSGSPLRASVTNCPPTPMSPCSG